MNPTLVVREILCPKFFAALPGLKANDESSILLLTAYAESLNEVSRLILGGRLDPNSLDFSEIFRLFGDKQTEIWPKRALRFAFVRAMGALIHALRFGESQVALAAGLEAMLGAVGRAEIARAPRAQIVAQLDNYFSLVLTCLEKGDPQKRASLVCELGPQVFELVGLAAGLRDSPSFVAGCVELWARATGVCAVAGRRVPEFLLFLVEMCLLNPLAEFLAEPKPGRRSLLYVFADTACVLIEPESLSELAQRTDAALGSPRLAERCIELALSVVCSLNQVENPSESAAATALAARILGLLHRRVGESPPQPLRRFAAMMAEFFAVAKEASGSPKDFETFANREFFDRRIEAERPDAGKRNPLVFCFVERGVGGGFMTALMGNEKISGDLFFDCYMKLVGLMREEDEERTEIEILNEQNQVEKEEKEENGNTYEADAREDQEESIANLEKKNEEFSKDVEKVKSPGRKEKIKSHNSPKAIQDLSNSCPSSSSPSFSPQTNLYPMPVEDSDTTKMVLNSLRRFCLFIQLRGESQVLERIMLRLSHRLASLFRVSSDSIFALLCATLMLNTDLHSRDVREKMPIDVFRKGVRSVLPSSEFPDSSLDWLYQSIQARELRCFDIKRVRDFTSGEFLDFSELLGRARAAIPKEFCPPPTSLMITPSLEETGQTQISAEGGLGLAALAAPAEARLLASIPALLRSCAGSADALELLAAFCAAPSSPTFADRLRLELQAAALDPAAFAAADGLALASAYTRLLAAVSSKSDGFAKLFWRFVVENFELFVFGFEDPIARGFIEKFESLARVGASTSSTRRGFSLLKSLVIDDTVDETPDSKALIISRGYRPAPPPLPALFERLRVDPPHLLSLISAGEAVATPTAAPRASAFVFWFLAELAAPSRLVSVLPSLLSAAGRVARSRDTMPRGGWRRFWSVSFSHLRASMQARIALTLPGGLANEFAELLAEMSPEALGCLLADLAGMIEAAVEPRPAGARQVAEAVFAESVRKDPQRVAAFSGKLEAFLAQVAGILIDESPDEGLFFLFELFDKSLDSSLKLNSLGLLLIPLRDDPRRSKLDNRLLVLLAEKVFSSISSPGLRISLTELPLLIFSLSHRLDLEILEPDKAAFLLIELLSAESMLRNKIGESPLLGSSILLVLAKSSRKIPANSLLALIKPAVASCIRHLKAQEDSANFKEMENQFVDFLKGANRSPETHEALRNAINRFGDNLAKRFLPIIALDR